MGVDQQAKAYEFGEFRLDASQRRLFGADGTPIELPSRAYDLLLYMVERPGDLLDTSALLKPIWPKTVVEESSLTQCIYALRRSLGEQPGEQRFIVTVTGRGYQFVARVRRTDESQPTQSGGIESPSPAESSPTNPPARSTRHVWALGTAAAILLIVPAYWLWAVRSATPATAASFAGPPPLKSIAVLPFADLTPDKDMEYFGDGLAEELMVT